MDRSVYHAAVWGSCSSLKDSTGEEDLKIGSQLTCGQGNTSLHIATKSGNKTFTEEILEKHPSLLLKQNAKGETALHVAARLGYVEVANLLISHAKRRDQVVGEARTDHLLIRAVNQEKNTALHEAVRNGHGDTVELLIGEDPSLTCVTNAAGESPLFIAVDRKFYEIARHILELFPSCSSSEKDGFLSGRSGMTVMHAAVIRLHYVPFGYMWKKRHLQRMRSAPLMVRCGFILCRMYTTCANLISMGFRQTCMPSFTEEEFVNELLEKCGHDILEIQDDYGWMPLHYVARLCNPDVMELFLRKNKNLAYIKDKEGMSALHISAGNGRNPTINVLINECPDICELLDNRDRTALHIAVETGFYTVVDNLLSTIVFSDLINEKDVDGNTALHVAAIHGRYRILKMLANEKRVDKDAINKAGMTVIDIIQSSSQIAKDKKVSLITMLKRNGSQPSLERRALMLERMLEQIDGLKKFEMTPETELKAAAGSTDSVAITSTTTGNEGKKAEKRVRRYNKWSPELVKNLANINLLVATIIASITFSAAIAVPGGFDSIDGIAILRRKTSFRFFLAFDSLAFGCSTASMSIHFLVTFTSRIIHETYAYPITGVLLLTLLSIASTVIAYIAGTNAVLNHHSSFGLSASIACTSFIVPVSFFLVRLVVVLRKRFRLLVDSEE